MNVLNIGTFDILHPGHVALLNAAARLGDLTVGVNSDAFVRRTKGRAPVMSCADRMLMLRAIGVRGVFEFDGEHEPVFEALRQGVYASGVDWVGRSIYAQWGLSPEWLAERGILVVYIETPWSALHSSDLRARL